VVSGVTIGETLGVGAKYLDCEFTFSATRCCRARKEDPTFTNSTSKMIKPIPITKSIFAADDFGGG
jgi:hypothetical protein